MDTKMIGSFLKELRKENNMTQVDLAKKLQVTDKAVSKWERGLGFPDIVQAKALLLLIEIPIEDDVGGARSLIVFLLQGIQRHGDHVPIVLRFLEQLADLDHIAGRRECHVPEAQAALFIDDLEHGINV